MKKEKNKVVTIDPQKIENSQEADTDNTGIAAQTPGGSKNEDDQVAGSISMLIGAEATSDALLNNSTTNTYAQSADGYTTSADQENSSEETNQDKTSSMPDVAPTSMADNDNEATASSVEEPTEKSTDLPTASLSGNQDEISESETSQLFTNKASAGKTKRKSTPKPVTQATRLYGVVYKENNTYFIKAGNVPQEQLQLLYPTELEDQIGQYNGQYVSIAGELQQKNKAGTNPTLRIQKIASHDQISQRAYELSQQNPDNHEANWLSAENQLLQS